MPVTIGALREGSPQETRVSVVPEVAEKFGQTGARILLEHGAGTRAQFPDSAYKNVVWADSADAVLEQADVVLTVQPLALEPDPKAEIGHGRHRVHAAARAACGSGGAQGTRN